MFSQNPPKDNKYAIHLQDVLFHYKKSDAPTLSIKHWLLKAGESAFLCGESGTGKSTLIHLLAGLKRPNSGSINLHGTHICKLSTSKRDRFRANHIGLVYQQFNLIPYLSVLDNILLAASFTKHKKRHTRQRAYDLLSEMGITPQLFQRKTEDLSIGQQQRVAIARAMINKPELLLMDEPTSALDTKHRDAFMDMLMSLLIREKSSLVFVSHDQSLAKRFDHTLELGELNSASQTRVEP